MVLGVDLDNTLICYDGLFAAEARRRGWLPDGGGVEHRLGVRDYLRSRGRDRDFTLLQGQVYGPGLAAAAAYPGALAALETLKKAGATIYVISHKTRAPLAGPPHDLRQAAQSWLGKNGFGPPEGLLGADEIFLEESLEAKLARAAAMACDFFVDDLPEFFSHPRFPAGATPLLFAPDSPDASPPAAGMIFASWSRLGAYLIGIQTEKD